MSGGSFNYLCHKSPWEIIDSYDAKENFELMNEELRARGLEDIAKEGEDIIQLAKDLDSKLEKLRDIWRAVEWFKSCDWGEDSINEAVKAYRESK